MIRDSAPDDSHDQLIALQEVNQLAQVLENDKIRLHPDDAISTKILIAQLSHQGNLTYYKDKQDPAPIDSGLPEDSFVLCIQTDYQLDAFRRLGNGFIGIDATHNTTQYQDLLLFTIVARDHWGHGKGSMILIFDNGLISHRRSSCLDADVKHDDRYHNLLCQMGQGRQSISPAWSDHDRS